MLKLLINAGGWNLDLMIDLNGLRFGVRDASLMFQNSFRLISRWKLLKSLSSSWVLFMLVGMKLRPLSRILCWITSLTEYLSSFAVFRLRSVHLRSLVTARIVRSSENPAVPAARWRWGTGWDCCIFCCLTLGRQNCWTVGLLDSGVGCY